VTNADLIEEIRSGGENELESKAFSVQLRGTAVSRK